METDYDIAILGGGPVGTALALLLARAARDPGRIALLRPPAGGAPASRDDPRVLALNQGSRTLLEGLGAWAAGGAPILDVHVSQRGRLGRTHISREDFGVAELGTVQAYGDVCAALDRAVADAGLTRLDTRGTLAGQDATAARIDAGGAPPSPALTAAICVHAEGGTFDQQEHHAIRRDYGQHAILAVVEAARPRPGWAWERFTADGPLALLPFPGAAASRYALVWCCPPDTAERLLALDAPAFGAALGEAFGTRMGALAVPGPRHVYPLGLNMRRAVVDGRAVFIGNAAQTLHPVAGQGLNLGLRDAARLAQALHPLLRAPGTDPAPLLAAYARARHGDRWLTSRLTDLMPRIFSTGLAPVEHACGLALLALDGVPALRRPLARHLMQGSRA